MKYAGTKIASKWLFALALTLPVGLGTGCAYQKLQSDVDDKPAVHTGVGASILYPGGRPPLFPTSVPGGSMGGGGTQGQTTRNGQTQGQSSSHGNQNPERSGGGLTYLGGNQGEETSSRTIKQEPKILKLAKVPLAMAAYPFVKAADALRGEAQPVEQPAPEAQAPRGDDVHAAHESNQLEAMERELASRGPAAQPAPRARPQPRRSRAPAPSGGSIADELAALRDPAAPVSPTRASAPGRSAPPAPSIGRADRVADRNHDGRPDHWSYLEAGQMVREQFDDNGDGVPDRIVHYDPATGDRRRLEEDRDQDGTVDTWVDYQDGAISRRRGDGNGDGTVDRWTFFRRGKIVRIEEDLDGDGFRDRIGHYDAGKVQREEEDRDGDGRTDRISFFDDTEQLARRDEDRDGDGVIDVRSFYENGKLARREMVESDQDAPTEESELQLDPAFGDS